MYYVVLPWYTNIQHNMYYVVYVASAYSNNE